MSDTSRAMLIAAIVGVAWPASSYAYIDPNAGGWLFQMIFPVLVAIAATWAFLKDKAKTIVRRLLGKLRSR